MSVNIRSVQRLSKTLRTRCLVIALIAASSLLLSVRNELLAAKPDIEGIEFAEIDDRALLLDLYLPSNIDGKVPLVIWVHGGAWRAGNRSNAPIDGLTEMGFAVASIDYRLSSEAAFPAQVHDIKAAIRFLRSESGSRRFDPDRFVIAGASAGGHLAALAGVSSGVEQLEGRVGDNHDLDSSVAAIVSFYGASNLQTILSQSTPHGLGVRIPALQLFLRSQPDRDPEIAALASPVNHVDPGDPPLLLIHGDQDPQMPINQSHELQGAYEASGRPAAFKVLHGAGHGGQEFYTPAMLQFVATFLREQLSVGDGLP